MNERENESIDDAEDDTRSNRLSRSNDCIRSIARRQNTTTNDSVSRHHHCNLRSVQCLEGKRSSHFHWSWTYLGRSMLERVPRLSVVWRSPEDPNWIDRRNFERVTCNHRRRSEARKHETVRRLCCYIHSNWSCTTNEKSCCWFHCGESRLVCVRINAIERVSHHLQASGEYCEGGGVGGVFSLLMRGSMIDGRTRNHPRSIDLRSAGVELPCDCTRL